MQTGLRGVLSGLALLGTLAAWSGVEAQQQRAGESIRTLAVTSGGGVQLHRELTRVSQPATPSVTQPGLPHWNNLAARAVPQFSGPSTKVDSHDFGRVTLGQSVTMTLSYTTAVSTLMFNTALNADFVATKSQCNGSVCTADVTFKPSLPGLRLDALTAIDSNQQVVFKTFLFGVGIGPQLGFDLGNFTSFSGQLTAPAGLAVGQDGYIYFGDAGTNSVYKFTPGGLRGTALTVANLGRPAGLAIDGANTLYIADQTNNKVVTLTAAGVQGAVITSPLSNPGGLAVDGTGALYISDNGNGRVIKIDNQGVETTIASGLNSPQGVAVDAAAGVYIADLDQGGSIVKYTAATGQTPSFLGTQLGASIRSVAVEAGGRVYFTSDNGIGTLFPPSGVGPTYGVGGTDVPYGLVVDNSGNLYTTYPNTGKFGITDRSTGNQILGVAVGRSASGTQQLANTGTAPLTLSGIRISGPTFTIDTANNQCGQGYTLAVATLCQIAFTFTPPAAQEYNETLSVFSNNLNLSAATNTYALKGLGQASTLAPSTTTLSSDYIRRSAGQPVFLTATVTGSGGQTPNGPVNFFDGTTMIGSAGLVAGATGTSSGTYNAMGLAEGVHNLTAMYVGDGNFSASTSAVRQVTIAPANTATTPSISFSQQSVAPGQPETITVTVQGASPAVPTGNVTIFDGQTNLGNSFVLSPTGAPSTAAATLTSSNFALGRHDISAAYGGDSFYTGSGTFASSFTVSNPTLTSNTALTVSATTLNVGDPLTLTATVTGGTIVSGTVTFFDGTTPLGTVTLTGSGSAPAATLTTSSLKAGVHSLTAAYNGDGNYKPSISAAQQVTVKAPAIASTTTLTVSAATITAAQPETLTAIVGSQGQSVPTGTVTFFDGTNVLGSGTLAPGPSETQATATLTTSALTSGSHSLTAVYGGNNNLLTSTSAAQQVVVNGITTTVSLAVSAVTLSAGQPETLTGTIVAGNGTPVLTGTVQFFDIAQDTILGTVPVTASATGGSAVFTLSTLPVGTHILGALYSGDTNYQRNTSALQTVTVNAVTTVLMGLAPSSGVVGKPVTVVLTGTNFNTGSVVQVNGAGQPTTFTSATQLSVVLPAQFFVNPGILRIGVVTGGSSTALLNFPVLAVPVGVIAATPGLISTFAGIGTAGNTGDLGPSKAAQLNDPRSGVVDAAGNVYVADRLNNTVRKIDTNGIITTFAGGSGGASGGNGDGGPATAAVLTRPADVAVDGFGNFYIADTGVSLVRKVDPNGIITTFAGGASGGVGDGGPATQALLVAPRGVAVDSAGNVYIADAGSNRVRKVDPNGTITTYAGTGTVGYTGDGGAATAATLNGPTLVRLDAAGNLYITDRFNFVVRKVSAKGIITTYAGTGVRGVAGDGGAATSATLRDPAGLAVATGYYIDNGDGGPFFGANSGPIVYVSDASGNSVRRVDGMGVITTVAGTGTAGFSGDGGPATAATLNGPNGLMLDTAGNLYIVDSGNNALRKVSATTGALAFAATAAGQSSAAQTVTLTNLGNVSVTLPATGQWTATGNATDFTLSGPCTSSPVLAPGVSCALQVVFNPTAAGARLLTYDLPVTGLGGVEHLQFTGLGTARVQTITFAPLPNRAAGDPAFTLSATASSGLPVSFEIVSGTASLTGSTVTLTSAGTVTIQATQAGDATYAAAAPVTQSFVVSATPSFTLTKLSPAGATLGSPAVTVTVTGTSFLARDTVRYNQTALATTFVNDTTLTAVVPATLLGATGVNAITVARAFGEGSVASAPLSFTVTSTPAIVLTGPATATSGQQPTLTFTLTNPYPIPLTGALTLAFAPLPGTPVDDPSVQFSAGGRSLPFTIPANSTVTPTVQIQTGTVAGTATITLNVLANGVNVTPATATPVVITIPAAAPVVSTAALNKAARTLTVVVHGFSNTRELTTAVFHFTGTNGAKIDTPDVTAPVTAIFAQWFQSTQSAQFGSSFTYTQDFTLSDDASKIANVTVTLTNSLGTSSPGTAQ